MPIYRNPREAARQLWNMGMRFDSEEPPPSDDQEPEAPPIERDPEAPPRCTSRDLEYLRQIDNYLHEMTNRKAQIPAEIDKKQREWWDTYDDAEHERIRREIQELADEDKSLAEAIEKLTEERAPLARRCERSA